MIRLWDVLSRRRVHLVLLLIGGVMIGCEGGSTSTGTPTTADPKVGKRNKDMQDFMDKEKKTNKGSRK
jgi:hypothetical protein